MFIGGARSVYDQGIYERLSLIAFFAWVGLGADGLSSSSYGPQESYYQLGQHIYLGIFVAIGTAVTVFVISGGYSQIIDHFPTGGGGYVVASKLLSPTAGMVSGCALLIDYVLTIAVSVSAGTDALFSFLPSRWLEYRLTFALSGVTVLTVMNLRGVKESVVPLVPIFLIFVATHFFAVLYAWLIHVPEIPHLALATTRDLGQARDQFGLWGLLLLLVRSYSMGAGTYTGIEAVSNGLPMLREPRVRTGKRTMVYMAVSLALMALGLMTAYTLFELRYNPAGGKTINALLFEKMASRWPQPWSTGFILVTLISEAAILFVAAQTGFLGGPRVIANMALDRWFPTRFAMLSDRLVTQNGVLLMGGAALVTMLATEGSVALLVVLYSINVFITFSLSQLGMVRHWWQARAKHEERWVRGLFINGLGLVLTSFILVSVTVVKFHEGGWVTLLVTGGLMALATSIRRHYKQTGQLLRRLDNLVKIAESGIRPSPLADGPGRAPANPLDPQGKAAVLLVNGFNGLGLHALFSIVRLFGGVFNKFIFVGIGVVDAGNFKGSEEFEHLREYTQKEVNRYVEFVRSQGYYAEGYASIGTDVVDELDRLAPKILERFPQAVFFGGQLVFPEDSLITRVLHNYIVFAVQRRFYHEGIPFVILPVRVIPEHRQPPTTRPPKPGTAPLP